jgi:TPR repeat protein
MYASGHGVPQDYVTAYMWFNLSAAQGDEDAAKRRDLIAQRMTATQIGEAQNLAREWKPTPQRIQLSDMRQPVVQPSMPSAPYGVFNGRSPCSASP